MKKPGSASNVTRDNGQPARDISRIFRERVEIDRAIARGVRDALRRHKQLGQSIVIWRDGQIVELQAHEIPDFDESND